MFSANVLQGTRHRELLRHQPGPQRSIPRLWRTDLAGVSQGQLSRYEQGSSEIGVAVLP